jgi:hypothetical protein
MPLDASPMPMLRNAEDAQLDGGSARRSAAAIVDPTLDVIEQEVWNVESYTLSVPACAAAKRRS